MKDMMRRCSAQVPSQVSSLRPCLAYTLLKISVSVGSTMVLPSVNEAIRVGDETATGREVTDIAQRFDAATRALQVATGLLQ